MQIGMIGLGRMGGAMARRLSRGGHEVVAWDRSGERIAELADEPRVLGAESLDAAVDALTPPRAVWCMVPAGEPTEGVLADMAGLCEAGDILIDGGNSNFHDTVRRAAKLRGQGVALLDAGTSGGVWGLDVGYCLMIGGEREAFERVEPAFAALAQPDGYAHVGPSGAGHFVKMVHNGIEYGLLQAYAEGFEILHASGFDLDPRQIAGVWNHGSVVRSWLLELAERALGAEGRDLEAIRGWVDDSGEGRWTVETALDLDVPAPVITHSLLARFRSRQEDSYSAKMIAALRNQFGGHAVRAAEPGDPSDTKSEAT